MYYSSDDDLPLAALATLCKPLNGAKLFTITTEEQMYDSQECQDGNFFSQLI